MYDILELFTDKSPKNNRYLKNIGKIIGLPTDNIYLCPDKNNRI
jgi:hypothetical protein